MTDLSASENRAGQIIKRAQRRLLPLLLLTYMISIVDRGNISFAALGMNADLHLRATDYGWVTGVFFIGYLLFEVPSNLALDRFGARVWIARIMITWGIVSLAMAFAWNAASLGGLRFLLGAAEAGTLPGILLYLTYWFPKEQRFRITSGFTLAIPITSALSAVVSSTLLSLEGTLGFHGWQWLFFIEGIPAVILGIVVLNVLPDRPKDARWLDVSEKTALQNALDEQNLDRGPADLKTIKTALASPILWALGFINFGFIICNYAVSFWFPQIVRGFGYAPVNVGLLVALPHAAGAVGMWLWGRVCHGRPLSAWMLLMPLFCGLAGMLLGAATLNSAALAVGFISFAALGLYASIPAFWTIATGATSSRIAAAGLAFVNTIGSLSGLIGPPIIGTLKDLTQSYATGFYATTVFLALSIVLTLLFSKKLFHTSASLRSVTNI